MSYAPKCRTNNADSGRIAVSISSKGYNKASRCNKRKCWCIGSGMVFGSFAYTICIKKDLHVRGIS